jgi:flagellar basal-body rod modification protein FlgD
MPVDSVTPTTPAVPPADMIKSASASMDKADFLQMLTAQLKAQDPMSPMSNEDFASQLAQFSSLQELQNMSKSLDQSLQANLLLTKTYSNTMASSLIGKTVKADMNSITMGSTGDGNIAYNLPDAATDVTVDILDSAGKTVRTLKLNAQTAGDHKVTWDGLNADGRRVAAGDYTYTVKATGADGNALTPSTYMEGKVSEIRYVDGNAILIVNGLQIKLGQVVSISDGDKG